MNAVNSLRNSMDARRRGITARSRGGFTMVEIMFSVLVVGILLGLLIVGARSATAYVRKTSDQAAVRNVAMAINEFKKQFGFYPPLVWEKTTGGGGAEVIMTPTPRKVRVYSLSTPAELAFLETLPPLDATNPFFDERFSIRSLPIYLVGGLNLGIDAAHNDPAANNFVPIDGVPGPGFCKPRQDGSFEVPPESLMTGGTKTSKRSNSYEPILNLGGSSLKLFVDPTDTDRSRISILDRNGIAIRYYRWEPANSASATLLQNLSVPRIVGRETPGFLKTPRERDLSENSALKGARWAVVGAGPNKVFGDEEIGTLRRELGASAGDTDEQVRAEAEEDNIVEVGQ
ncbi:MAG TPA: hypothetical protein VD997_05290 [Phycisphaerales bacterium]|nr:hypothetical protein [Phycisphaerales bacterium]